MNDFKNNLKEIYPKLKKHGIYISSKDDVNLEADDLVHMTIIKALKNHHQFDGKYLLAWLKRIMKNIAIDDYRKGLKVESQGEDRKYLEDAGKKHYRRVDREIGFGAALSEDSEDDSDDKFLSSYEPKSSITIEASSFNKKTDQENIELEEELNIMNNCLNKIGESCKEILLLWGAGYKYKELSERLSIPMSAATTNLSRCRIKLKECVQKTKLLVENNEI